MRNLVAGETVALDLGPAVAAQHAGGLGLARNIAWIGALLIASILFGTALGLWHMRQTSLSDNRATLHAEGVAIAEQTARAIQAVDLVVQSVQARVVSAGGAAELVDNAYLRSNEFHMELQTDLQNLPQVDALSLIGASGDLLAISRVWPVPKVSFVDRDYFIHLRDHDDGSAYVSEPVQNRITHHWTFYVGRRVNGPGGKFLGIVLGAIPVSYFEDFFRNVTDKTTGAVSLIRRDGILMARYPEVYNTVIGMKFPPYAAWPGIVTAGGGVYETEGAPGFSPRIVSVHPLQLYPLVVDIGVETTEALKPWRSTADVIAVAVLLVCVGFLLLFRVLARQFRTLDRQRIDMAATAEELAQSERRVQEHARVIETTLSAMEEGVIMVDSDGRVMLCNERAAAILNLPKELFADRPPFERILEYKAKVSRFVEADERSDASGWIDKPASGPRLMERVTHDGRYVEIHTATLPEGGFVRTYLDITERRRADALRLARDEAQRVLRAKSDFLATMSHEIRSPLSGLLGVVELLRGTPLDADQKRMTEMVHNSGSTLLSILNDILDFSKIEADALTIQPEPIQLQRLLEDVVQPNATVARQRGLTVTLAMASGLPNWISADPLRLRQIVGNLLSNALKFTHAGGAVTVRAAPGDHDEVGPMLRITVQDSGIGISDDAKERLFKPFTQAEGSTTRRFGGTGLGLSISRKLALLMGGDLSMTSKLGEGSIFTLELPLRPCDTAADEAPAPEQVGHAPLVASGRRILVVDDDPTIRWLSQRQLETLGCVVKIARDGATALEALDGAAYDLVLTDCHMPVMDGVALTRAIRAADDPARRGMPIIGLTADVTEAQREACMDSGMTALAIKPLSVKWLAELLAAHLPNQKAGSAEEAKTATEEVAELRALPFDDQIYVELFSRGDAEGTRWLHESFAAIRSDVEELDRLFDLAPEPPDLRNRIIFVAHRLAGASFSIGAILLGQAARALEHAGLDGNFALSGQHDRVKVELEAAAAAIDAFVAGSVADGVG